MGIDILSSFEIEIAERDLADGFFYAVASALLICQAVVFHRFERVFAGQVEIADGVVYLIEIFFVTIPGSHTGEFLYFFRNIFPRIDFGLFDPSIEFGSIGWIHADDFSVCLVCFRRILCGCIELRQQECHSDALLFARSRLNGRFEKRNGFFVFSFVNKVIGIDCRKPVVLGFGQFLVVDFEQYIFRFVQPAHSDVTPSLPNARLCYQIGHPSEMAGYIKEGRSGSEEIAFVVLCFSHKPPCVVNKRVVFVPFHILPVFGIAHFFRISFRPFLNGMQLYGFLTFLDSPIETSRWLRVFGICIGLCRMHEQEVREIILVSFFHLFELFFVIFYSVEIDVVTGGKAMVKTCHRRILFRGTRYECKNNK